VKSTESIEREVRRIRTVRDAEASKTSRSSSTQLLSHLTTKNTTGGKEIQYLHPNANTARIEVAITVAKERIQITRGRLRELVRAQIPYLVVAAAIRTTQYTIQS
jgi:hypothetical protein